MSRDMYCQMSEVSATLLDVPTDGTPDGLLLSVALVVSPNRALVGSFALGQLVLSELADVLALALLLVTPLAEVCVAPAEPLRHRAAELTLEFNVVLAMFWAVLNWDLAAVGAHQLLLIELPRVLLHCVLAGFSAPEVRLLAFEALVISKDS